MHKNIHSIESNERKRKWSQTETFYLSKNSVLSKLEKIWGWRTFLQCKSAWHWACYACWISYGNIYHEICNFHRRIVYARRHRGSLINDHVACKWAEQIKTSAMQWKLKQRSISPRGFRFSGQKQKPVCFDQSRVQAKCIWHAIMAQSVNCISAAARIVAIKLRPGPQLTHLALSASSCTPVPGQTRSRSEPEVKAASQG